MRPTEVALLLQRRIDFTRANAGAAADFVEFGFTQNVHLGGVEFVNAQFEIFVVRVGHVIFLFCLGRDHSCQAAMTELSGSTIGGCDAGHISKQATVAFATERSPRHDE